MTDAVESRYPPVALDCIYYAIAIGFTLYILYYYWTGANGETFLALGAIPITYVLFTLNSLRANETLSKAARRGELRDRGGLLPVLALLLLLHDHELRGARHRAHGHVGSLRPNCRRRHDPADHRIRAQTPHAAVILNIVLILYAVYGYLVPGMFYHAGLSWLRVVAASSVEMATGIFARLPQLALTVIGAFLLVLSLLRGFGCVNSLLRATKRVAIRSPHAIPQSAVIGSMAIGTVSGSGAANSITVGSATIPAMIQAGLPPATAAAIENSSSMGGQLMPPVMGIAAFLMAEFLGVDYFDVVARGWVPALIYYISVSTSVYLLATFHHTHMVIDPSAKRLDWRDRVNLGAFVFVVGGLVALMATIFLAPMFAALYMFCAAGFGLLFIHVVSLLRNWSLREFIAPLQRVLDSYIDMITDIALLLATLSIMTGALVITGVPTKLGALLVEAAGVNMAAMVAMAFIFGAILGTGLPPAPVYILVAIVIFPAITPKSPPGGAAEAERLTKQRRPDLWERYAETRNNSAKSR